MGRTIPWLKEQPPKFKRQSSDARSSKRRKILDSFAEPEPSPIISTPRRRIVARVDRTPSTSPPPQPPEEAFMREGLEQDDIYIMVEDEFHTVAKIFTQRLHHDEYIRLKNIAKNRNSKDTLSVARPIDSITLMREDTKRRKEQEAKATRQRAGLDTIRAQATSKRPETVSSDESEDVARAYDDPWVGTALEGLMISPSRNRISLTGLQNVKSYTRAAAGCSKQRDLPEHVKTFDLAPKKGTTRVVQSTEDAALDHDMRTSENEDDLGSGSILRGGPSISNNELPSQKTNPQEQHWDLSAQEDNRRKAIGNHGFSPSKRLLDPTSSDPMDHCPAKYSRGLQSGQVRDRVLPSLNLLDESWPKPTPLKSAASKKLIRRGASSTREPNELSKTENATSKIYEIPSW